MPLVWSLRSALLLEAERRILDHVRAEFVRRGSGDLDQAANADEALDMIGGVSRPYDVILLGSGRMQLESAHVLAMLVKQRSPSVVLGYSIGLPAATTALRSYLGVADWLDLRDGDGWPRRLVRALADGASVRRIVETGKVPTHIEAPLAKAIYGAAPGAAYPVPKT